MFDKDIKIGYKICKVTDYQLLSINADRPVVYIPGEWAKPYLRCGPLAVFDTLENVKDFFRGYYGYHTKNGGIFKCEYIPYTGKGEELYERKHLFSRGTDHISTLEWCPHGTILASKVKLIKRIV